MLAKLARLTAAFGLCLGQAMAMDEKSMETFHDAVNVGALVTVQTMLAVDPALARSSDRFGFQPIHLLDIAFDENILELLLANGADINAANDEGVTLLHLVADARAVPVLVARGARLETRDVRGWTPILMQADERDRGAVVAALLAAGANPNARGKRGETVLGFVQASGDATLVRALRRAGAVD